MHALRAMFRDTAKSWSLGSDGIYGKRRPALDAPPFRVQQALQDEARRTASRAGEHAGVTFHPEQRQA